MSSAPGWHRGLLLIVAFASAPAWAGNGAPQLVIQWSINGGPVNLILPVGQSGGGIYTYQGVDTDPATGLELAYDLDGHPMSAIDGNVNILNELSDDIDVNVDVWFALVADLPAGTLLAGLVTIGLTTGPGGGQLSSQPPAVFQTRVDGVSAGFNTTLFWDPFFIGSGGQGNSSTHGNYGIPDPVPGPPLFSNLGYSLRFTLTPGDRGSITADVTATGETVVCSEDIDGSGEVDITDLVALAASWGPCADCPADLNANGDVGVPDLLLLIQAWGPCGG